MEKAFEEFKKSFMEQIEAYRKTNSLPGIIREFAMPDGEAMTEGICLMQQENEMPDMNKLVFYKAAYEIYQKEKNMSEIIRESLELLYGGISMEALGRIGRLTVNDFQPFLIPHLGNEEMLENIPHVSFEDLELVFGTILEDKESNAGKLIVTESLIKKWGLTAEQLYEKVMNNRKMMDSCKILPLQEVLRQCIAFPIYLPPDLLVSNGYLFTNQSYYMGAGAVLYSEKLQEVSEKLDSDLYVLLVSMNEAIVMSAKEESYPEMCNYARYINLYLEGSGLKLSQSVYFYDGKTKTFERVQEEK